MLSTHATSCVFCHWRWGGLAECQRITTLNNPVRCWRRELCGDLRSPALCACTRLRARTGMPHVLMRLLPGLHDLHACPAALDHRSPPDPRPSLPSFSGCTSGSLRTVRTASQHTSIPFPSHVRCVRHPDAHVQASKVNAKHKRVARVWCVTRAQQSPVSIGLQASRGFGFEGSV